MTLMTYIHGTKTSVAEIVEPVDEWRVHEQSNKEKRSQGQGKHHAEKARKKEGGQMVPRKEIRNSTQSLRYYYLNPDRKKLPRFGDKVVELNLGCFARWTDHDLSTAYHLDPKKLPL